MQLVVEIGLVVVDQHQQRDLVLHGGIDRVAAHHEIAVAGDREALSEARESKRPVLIDFKGHACANCKKMDALVWSDPEVQRRIREDFVLVGLYVDDRTKLPDDEVFVSKIDGKEKKTMGKKNEDIEISMFNTNSLPLYAIVDPEGNPLIETRGTDFDIKAYIDWLDRGAEAFGAQH